jgi:hypothetical protein
MKTTFRKVLMLFLAAAIVQSACIITAVTPVQPTPNLPTPITATSSPNPADTQMPPPEGVYPPSFASYNEIASRLPQTFNGGGYTLPLDMSQVDNPAEVEFSETQLNLLSKNGFVVTEPVPGQFREFYQIYEQGRYSAAPVFITTDSIYHVYHLIFDKMLRDLETERFITDLKMLTSAMLAATYQQYQTLRSTALEEPALRNVAYFAVAAQLLGLPDAVPPEAADLVSAELALINAASDAAISPIWDRPDLPPDQKLIEVYGQYKPRGHYTRSEALKMYFKAMMWYGRLTFRLNDDFETRRALLLTQALRTATVSDGSSALVKWKNIYEPTVFIVGKADDLGYLEYGALSDQIFGQDPNLSEFADPTLFAQFKQATESLPPPQINSMWVWIWQDQEQVTKGFRFMGQRFTLDAYVFGQVLWRKVGTLNDPRGLPKGLDFFAALGSEEAYTILDDMGETHYANFDTQLNKVKTEVASLGIDSWTQNLYWSWLYSFLPLIEIKGSAYPPFMQTEAWTRKSLHTALGSWTELKHDTILYAKQVMAEMGGGGNPTPPHGYVEPDPQAYARLLSLTQMTYDGLQSRSLLSELTSGNLENLISELSFLKDISERELAGEAITDDEYWHIQYWGGILEQFTLKAADTTGNDDRDLSDQKAALVADVATGIDAEGNLLALEEGVGQPTFIYVVLPDAPLRIAKGAVYSYYEFTVPSSGRLTDEEWQAQVENGTNAPQPDWTQLFIAP